VRAWLAAGLAQVVLEHVLLEGLQQLQVPVQDDVVLHRQRHAGRLGAGRHGHAAALAVQQHALRLLLQDQGPKRLRARVHGGAFERWRVCPRRWRRATRAALPALTPPSATALIASTAGRCSDCGSKGEDRRVSAVSKQREGCCRCKLLSKVGDICWRPSAAREGRTGKSEQLPVTPHTPPAPLVGSIVTSPHRMLL